MTSLVRKHDPSISFSLNPLHSYNIIIFYEDHIYDRFRDRVKDRQGQGLINTKVILAFEGIPRYHCVIRQIKLALVVLYVFEPFRQKSCYIQSTGSFLNKMALNIHYMANISGEVGIRQNYRIYSNLMQSLWSASIWEDPK